MTDTSCDRGFEPWTSATLEDLWAVITDAVTRPLRGPTIVAVDGRSSSGKTTLSSRLSQVIDGVAVVHTDDVAWWHSFFHWTPLLIKGVLEPLRRGDPVAFRPPAWDERARPGAIQVAAGVTAVLVEGVGAGRHDLAPFLDAVVWVNAEREHIDQRNAAKVDAGEATRDLVRDWMAEEEALLSKEQTWLRACAVVAGDDAPRGDRVLVRRRRPSQKQP